LLEGERVLFRGHPSWRANIGYFLLWIPVALLPAIIAGLLRSGDDDTGLPYWQWILISIVLVGIVIAVDVIRRASTFYAVTTQRLRVRQGILARNEQTTRFDRIQNVNISQSLFDRLLNIGAVDFDTAGSGEEQADFVFRGISRPQRLVRIVAENSDLAGARHPSGL
jgi:uncharacterized membrane protein YdbT with pleckstrin-like domain